MVGYYHSIDTMGTVDGQGIRYLVFLAGCNLGCLFCHNPDTWKLGTKTITVEEIIADFNRYRPFYEASNGGITVSGGEPLLQADFVAELLQEFEPACTNFREMPPSVKKTYTRAYFDAKTEAGRNKRLLWMVERLNKNMRPM